LSKNTKGQLIAGLRWEKGLHFILKFLAGNRNREQGTRNREQGIGNWEQGKNSVFDRSTPFPKGVDSPEQLLNI
jgi:hypothetical protein